MNEDGGTADGKISSTWQFHTEIFDLLVAIPSFTLIAPTGLRLGEYIVLYAAQRSNQFITPNRTVYGFHSGVVASIIIFRLSN